jgi:DNA repair protein RadC
MFMIEKQPFLNSVVSEIELRYIPKIPFSQLPHVSESMDAYHFFITTWDKDKLQFIEQFRVMLLTDTNKVLGICTISTGCPAYITIEKKILFGTALKANASKIILAYNHPSGILNPSTNDTVITKRIKEAGQILGIVLYDYLIVSGDGYYSFADHGAL